VKLSFRIRGMDCAEEVAALRSELAPIAGIRELTFEVLNRKMSVEIDSARVSADDVIAAVARAGMQAEPWSDPGVASNEAVWGRWGRTLTTVVSLGSIVAGFWCFAMSAGWNAAVGLASGPTAPLSSQLLFVIAAIAGGWYVFPKAWRALVRLRPDMNLLMTIAVAGAFAIGESFEAATVAFLFSFSLSLEAWRLDGPSPRYCL
jgi:Zn2+/Cd2+-exporting ATPase